MPAIDDDDKPKKKVALESPHPALALKRFPGSTSETAMNDSRSARRVFASGARATIFPASNELLKNSRLTGVGRSTVKPAKGYGFQ